MTQHNQLATAEQVNQGIGSIAEAILTDFPDRSPLFVALLRGAAPFAGKLMTEITRQSPEYHPELDYMMVSTYGEGQQAGEPRIVTDLAPSTAANGRDVIVIDDVLDKGITADFVARHLRVRGAAAIKLAVLCDKTTTREKDIEADYKAFTFGDNWLVGMGMDDASAGKEAGRWLEEIREVAR